MAVTGYGQISVYDAVFVKNMINADVNYGRQAYQKQKIWWSNTCDQENGYALWNYRAGDIMKLCTSDTMFFKTEILKAAANAGFNYLLLEGVNLTSEANAYFNEQLQDFGRNALTVTNCKNKQSFDGFKIVVKMSIENIKNSDNDFTALVGVDNGKIVITGLRFLKEDITITNQSGLIYKNRNVETISLKTTDMLSLQDLMLEADGKSVGFELYLDGIKVKANDERRSLSAGTYYMTAKSISELYAIAICKVVCSEPLAVDDEVIIDEFCTEEYIDYFYDIYKTQFTSMKPIIPDLRREVELVSETKWLRRQKNSDIIILRLRLAETVPG